jgi:hypothetical protein
MILHLYLNENRLKDLSQQIALKANPNEKKTIEKEILLNGEISGGLPSWMKFFGLSGEGKLGSEGKISINTEIEPYSIEYALLKIFKKYFLKNNFLLIDEKTQSVNSKNNLDIVRIKRAFKILVDGNDAYEKMDNYQKMPYIEWESNSNGLKVILSTTQESYTGRTPIFQCLNSKTQELELDVLGIISSIEKREDIEEIKIIPIYFGVDINL